MARIVEGLGRCWAWPDADRECIKAIFGWLADLQRAVDFCKQRRTVIQAGGNMGVWPWELSRIFARVVTAEPDPECFALMRENLQNATNIETHQVALLESHGGCVLNVEPANRG